MTRLELSEADWATQFEALYTLYRWMAHHCRPARKANGQWSTPITGDPGFPDYVLVRGSRVLWVELKTNRGTLTRDQMAWRDRLLLAGMDWYCWRPRDLERVEATLAPAPWSNLRLTEDVDTKGRVL